MTPDMWLALGILVVAIILFISERVRVDIVALGVVVALALSGLLTVQEAIAGFSNTAVITIAALFIVGGAVMHTGLARAMGNRILAVAGNSPARLTAVIMLAVAFMSFFMSDTGVVAVMLPAVVALAADAKLPPSKLLIPLAYGSLLGGLSTLIGTPPNLIASDALRDYGYQPFGFFSYTPLGLVLIAAGVLYMVLVGRKLLPARTPDHDIQRVETPEELVQLYRLPDNLWRLRVRHNSRLVGHTVTTSRFGSRFEVSALEIIRPAGPQADGHAHDDATPVEPEGAAHIRPVTDVELVPDDVLLVQGDPVDVQQAAAYFNLAIQPISSYDQEALVTDEIGIAEIVLPPRSSLIGKTLPDTRFGSTYHLTVLDIRRSDASRSLNLKTTPLEFGDTLLVQGEWKNIIDLKRHRRDFVVMGDPERLAGPAHRQKAPVALAIMAGMVVLMITGLVPVATASLLAALLMVLTGCLSMDEAYDAMDWKSIVLIAGMLPMATALEKVGLVDLAVDGTVTALGGYGPQVLLAGIFLLTTAFTQVLSNTATAVLVAPIAIATAQRIGIQPHAFVMAVAVGASMTFTSPISSPVNTLVLGAGSYRFTDFVKVGLPVILFSLVIAVLVLPVLFPFN